VIIMKMDREQFFNSIVDLYLVCQAADSKRNPNGWTHPAMASFAGCQKFDDMFRAMVDCGLLSAAQRHALYEMIISRMLYDEPDDG
jgi:hypothetical protein